MLLRLAAFVGFLTLSVAYTLDVRTHAISPVTCSAPWASGATETTLRIAFRDQVRAENVDIGEGEEAPGALVYPDDPRQTVFVVWKDAAGRYPLSVEIREKSQQVTYGGIGIGTTLKALERLNGRPFELAGFDWDYSGTVTSWEGGRLETVGGSVCELKVRLDPGPTNRQEQKAALDATAGDRLFKSSDRNMQILNPKVYEVLLLYR
jgi:hypothetical protein